MSSTRSLILVGLAFTAACSDMGSSNTVAEAAGHRLTVDRTVELLADLSLLPAQGEVVQALADLWVDYTLLATVAAQDSTLASVDLSAIIDQRAEQELITRLRDTALEVDTIVEEAELRALYDDLLPGAAVRARHILLGFDATRGESRDSALALAGNIKTQLERGADFAQLAGRYSIDPGTSANGGDLGFFDRQTMVPAFGDVAFALQPGVISEPVVTQFGVHLIRVDERRIQPFDSVRVAFLNQIKNQRMAEVEDAFIGEIEASANVQIQDDAFQAVRNLAQHPTVVTTERASERALVSFDGGALTASDFQLFVLNQAPALRSQIVEATDEQLAGLLESVARGKLLVAEAQRRGLEVTQMTRDTLTIDARVQLQNAADQLDVRGLASESGDRDRIVADKVDALLGEMLRGERDVIPLGVLGYTLRLEYGGRVNDAGVERALVELRELRAASAPDGATTGEAGIAPPNPVAPVQPADTSGTP